MELYFIRHGQSINNAHWGAEGFQDHSDPELTIVGHSQAKILAEYLEKNQERDESVEWNSQNQAGFGLTHIYTSLMVRAVATAEPIAKTLNLPLHAWPEIHETGGIFSRVENEDQVGLPGKPRSYFEGKHPNLILPDWLDEKGWWNRPFEEREFRKSRAEMVWQEILKQHGDQPKKAVNRVAVISHGGFFNYLLTSALGINFPPKVGTRNPFWFLMNNCAISRFDFDSEQVLVCYINRHDYLPNDLLT